MIEPKTTPSDLGTVDIKTSADILRARQAGSEFAAKLGFGAMDQTRIATAISEIARNVLQHSGTVGIARFSTVSESRLGLVIEVEDRGRGIVDLEAAMRDGYSTSVTSLGAGLPGSKRLMDLFDIQSIVGKGTVVRMTKWLPRHRG